MTGIDHLDRRVEVTADVRDRLRSELGMYGCGTTMLDGVSRDVHQSVVVNGLYHLTPVEEPSVKPLMQDETLFTAT